jgi:hypothetical protein
MTLPNLDYINEEQLSEVQRSTTIEIENPEHPENFRHQHVPKELLTEMFEAGEWAQECLGPQRSLVVGDFLMCLKQAEQDDNYEPLYNLIEELQGDEMARNLETENGHFAD